MRKVNEKKVKAGREKRREKGREWRITRSAWSICITRFSDPEVENVRISFAYPVYVPGDGQRGVGV